ncbi:Tex family protein [Salegentibacter chungangensis]|uniref:Tex family protein n=1 Tax=Salegentibacter chungangensis TaxID=1335724 RepID=A0ABW3NTT8_9FLAO
MQLLEFIKPQIRASEKHLKNTLDLLKDDASIPFIARYRKEHTGNMDETEIEKISGLLKLYNDLEKRKESILKAIKEQEALTEDLQAKIEAAPSLIQLEDLYLPFKKKRKTKAEAARQAGLEPLAKIIMAQNSGNIQQAAHRFVKGEISSAEAALEGAQHIIAEWISENGAVRNKIRRLFRSTAVINAKKVKTEAEKPEAVKYKQYFDWSEPVKRIASHRFLAIHRAEKEGFLRIKLEVEKQKAFDIISGIVLKQPHSSMAPVITAAIEDSFKRLIKPSFDTEILNEAKEKADDDAIGVFAANLEQLLMAAPLGEKRILALDPGFKSGCKLVCLDERGKLLYNETIYPHPPQKEVAMASKKVKSLVNAYDIEAIAIGNGTASRETESFIKNIRFDRDLAVFIVNEAGASVYSASKVAREEFPEYDITVRGAVSIGRRLSDPLSELVKIDPKAIGVGQYQHEVDQTKLKAKLDMVVASCVNRIGVNLNTAGKELLSYVSGIGPALAQNIVEYRNEQRNFPDRQELLKVPRLGAKAFEQSAGFLRIKDGKNPLDDSAVHPESYPVVKKIAKDQGLKVSDLIANDTVLDSLELEKYTDDQTGLISLKDIVKELKKPGADPRKALKQFEFDPSVKAIEDLKPGMRLPGIVNNITNFGCFVDIGIKERGLVHISKLANQFVSDVNSIVKLNQEVEVMVLSVDLEQKRVQLSLID